MKKQHPVIPIKFRHLKQAAGNDPLKFLDLLPKEMAGDERSDALLKTFPEMDREMADTLANSWKVHRNTDNNKNTH